MTEKEEYKMSVLDRVALGIACITLLPMAGMFVVSLVLSKLAEYNLMNTVF